MSLFSPEITYFYRCYQCSREWGKTWKGFWRIANMPDRPTTPCPCCGEYYAPNAVWNEAEGYPEHLHR